MLSSHDNNAEVTEHVQELALPQTVSIALQHTKEQRAKRQEKVWASIITDSTHKNFMNQYQEVHQTNYYFEANTRESNQKFFVIHQ